MLGAMPPLLLVTDGMRSSGAPHAARCNSHDLATARQARKLEGELDVKLANYAKLCSGFESSFRSKPDSEQVGSRACSVRWD